MTAAKKTDYLVVQVGVYSSGFDYIEGGDSHVVKAANHEEAAREVLDILADDYGLDGEDALTVQVIKMPVIKEFEGTRSGWTLKENK